MEASDSSLITRLFFRLLPIQILLLMVSAVNGIVSSMFASNFVGGDAMSAIGLFGPINMFIGAVCTMFVAGSQILCGKYMGRNQLERTQSVFSTDILVMLILSAATVALLLAWVMTGLTRIMTDAPPILAYLNRYIIAEAVGFPPFMLIQQLTAFLSMENQSRRTTVGSVVCIAVNAIMNYLLVVVMKLDTLGLGLASSLGMWVFLAIQVQYYFTGKSSLKLFARAGRLSDMLDIVKTGYAGAIGNAYQTLRGFIVNSLILSFVGPVGLSSFAASGSALGLFWTIPAGITAVARMLMSVSIGEEDRKTLIDVMKVGLFRCIPLMCCISAGIIASAVPLTRLFYRDAADPVYQMTVMGFRILPLCMPLSIICLLFTCYGQSSGKTLLVNALTVLDGVVFVAAFSAVLVPLIGMNGVYVANVLNGVAIVLVIVAYSWIVRRAFPRCVVDLMLIPEDFGVSEDERIDITVRSMEDVLNLSQQVIDFCEARGIDGRRAYHAGLFLEEMAGNVVEHGFHKDRKDHAVDIRVVHKSDDVILRIRDNCVPFNPTERQAMTVSKNNLKGVGIRMVIRGAKEMTYQNIFGTNVLTIRT